jgi:hypothetical protein
METNHYLSAWPDMIPALEAALLRYEEGVANMADFEKKYTSVKNKMKRIEKYMVSMDEESQKWYQSSMLNTVRLAENKFNLINKKLARFKEQEKRSCKASLKQLKGASIMERNMTVWHIARVSAYLQHVDRLLYGVADMLRIAKGHLDKVSQSKKYLAKVRRRGMG